MMYFELRQNELKMNLNSTIALLLFFKALPDLVLMLHLLSITWIDYDIRIVMQSLAFQNCICEIYPNQYLQLPQYF